MKIEELISKFLSAKLLKEEWNHNSHIKVAIYFIKKYDFFDAICKIKSGIILLNNQHKTINSGDSGYHETLTIFWAKIIKEFIEKNKNLNTEKLIDLFLNSEFSNKSMPLKYYSKEKLFSPEYRAIYHPPTKNL